MPIVLLKQGYQLTYSRGLTNQHTQHFGGTWYSGSSINKLLGLYAQQKSQKLVKQGDKWNLKAAGFEFKFYLKQSYMFYLFHTRHYSAQRQVRDYTWKYRSNDPDRVLRWFNDQKKPWYQKGRDYSSATSLFIKTASGPQLIKALPSSEYRLKAYVAGRAWWETGMRNLEPECFGKHAAKGQDFAVYNTADEAMQTKFYTGHSRRNQDSFRRQMQKNNKNAVLFWPKPHGRGFHLQYWSHNAARTEFGSNSWKEAVGRLLLKECQTKYVTGKKSVMDLGLPH